MGIVELELSGGPRERGRRHGTLLRSEIQELWRAWTACAARQSRPLEERELLEFTGRLESPAEAFAPSLCEEIAGIAEASGIGYHRAFALSCWDELCSWLAGRDLPRGGGCTSFAVTSERGTIIGQNQDAWTWWRPVVVARHLDPDRYPVLVATHPGVLGVLGVSAGGLGIVANSLMPTDRGVGVPFAILLRKALEARSVSAAVATITAAPRATGANWVIASAAEAVDLETTRQRAHRTAVRSRYAHSNHYLADELADLEDGIESLPDTVPRQRRMHALLAVDSWANAGAPPPAPERMLTYLADHEGAPTAICRHPAASPDDMETLAATVLVPGENLMVMTDGPPCCSPPVRFSLEAGAYASMPA